MVIIMLGIYGAKSRLYVSSREDRVDEGLDIYSKRKKEYKEQAKKFAELRAQEIIKRADKATKISKDLLGYKYVLTGGLSCEVMEEALNKFCYGSYPEIVKRAMKAIAKKAVADDYDGVLIDAKKLAKFVMNTDLNEVGDGWKCLSDEQSAARDLLCYMAL